MWLDHVVSWDFDSDPTYLQEPICQAELQVDSSTSQHLEAARKRWRQWVQDKLMKGAAAIHSSVKRAEQSPTVLQGKLEDLDASPQAVVDAEHKKRSSIWLRIEGRYGTPWRDWKIHACEALAPISAEQIRKAALTFSAKTAIGEDLDAPTSLCLSLRLH